ncbi:MAG: 4Fe-4S dicluster domain [Pseudomonadota bacterium]
MDSAELLSCVFCPRLCRHVCPVAVGSGREAATPTAMMTGVWAWTQGRASGASAFSLASLCVSCGACTSFCKLHRPVPELLAQARAEIGGLPEQAAPGRIEGGGELVAVEADGRRWAEALAAHLGRPVARFRTEDSLGAVLLGEPARFGPWARALRDRLAGRTLVVADHESLAVARAAELTVVHLVELVPALPADRPRVKTCGGPQSPGPEAPLALACCGGRSLLRAEHPALAAEVGAGAAARTPPGAVCADSRCGAWLRQHGAQIDDPVSLLLEAQRPSPGPAAAG